MFFLLSGILLLALGMCAVFYREPFRGQNFVYISGLTLGTLCLILAFVAPCKYEDFSLKSTHELLQIEEITTSNGENEIYVISSTEQDIHFVCVKRLDENIPQSVEIYTENVEFVDSEEYYLKTYVAKPKKLILVSFSLNSDDKERYEICVPEKAVLKINTQ